KAAKNQKINFIEHDEIKREQTSRSKVDLFINGLEIEQNNENILKAFISG
ncbi:27729_t:CDS:2, partial [Racocetra persica]